jgi:hypothetical protein
MALCSPSKVNRRFGGKCRVEEQAKQETRMKQKACLVMEATCSSATSTDFERTTQSFILEDVTLHSNFCQNFKSYRYLFIIPANSEIHK